MREAQVAVLQALEVAQHLVLAVVQVEDGLLQELGAAREAAGRVADLRSAAAPRVGGAARMRCGGPPSTRSCQRA